MLGVRTLPLAVALLRLPVLVGGALRARCATARALACGQLRGRLVLACACAPRCQGRPCIRVLGWGFLPMPRARACGQVRGRLALTCARSPAVPLRASQAWGSEFTAGLRALACVQSPGPHLRCQQCLPTRASHTCTQPMASALLGSLSCCLMRVIQSGKHSHSAPVAKLACTPCMTYCLLDAPRTATRLPSYTCGYC